MREAARWSLAHDGARATAAGEQLQLRVSWAPLELPEDRVPAELDVQAGDDIWITLSNGRDEHELSPSAANLEALLDDTPRDWRK